MGLSFLSIGLLVVTQAGCGDSPAASVSVSEQATVAVPQTTAISTTVPSVDTTLSTATLVRPAVRRSTLVHHRSTSAPSRIRIFARALQTMGSASPLDNEDVAAVAEGRAPGESICADILRNNEPGAGEVPSIKSPQR